VAPTASPDVNNGDGSFAFVAEAPPITAGLFLADYLQCYRFAPVHLFTLFASRMAFVYASSCGQFWPCVFVLLKGIAMTEFEKNVAASATSHCFQSSLIDVNESVEFAKKILLNNKVQNFTAADVVALTDIIIQRQQYLNTKSTTR
jgi:hypothetical protein